MKTLRAALLGLAATAACTLGAGRTARADFLFSPTGNGAPGAQFAAAFDPIPGNALAQGGVTAINNFAAGGPAVGNTFQLYYQATMGAINNATNNPITTGTYAGLNTSYQITVVASITEVVTAVSGNVAQFAVAPVQTNGYLQFYQAAGAPIHDDLAGTGFKTPGLGQPILSATPIVTNSSGVFANTGAVQTFDQHGANNYPGVTSVVGSGASTIDFLVGATNPNYFVTPPPTVISLEFTTTNTVPFKVLDPSKLFQGLGPAGVDITPSIGLVNGSTGPDFQFVADGNVSTVVPEPSSLALTGLGLAGVVAFARRKRAQVA